MKRICFSPLGNDYFQNCASSFKNKGQVVNIKQTKKDKLIQARCLLKEEIQVRLK